MSVIATPPMRTLATLFLLMGSVLLVSCTEHNPYVVSELSLERLGWDSVRVDVRFARVNAWGKVDSVERPATTLNLFNATFDTLYSGPELILPVPDRTLASEEPLLVEVCGRFDGMNVCEQKGFLASPKRIDARHDLDYPQNGDVEQGSYTVNLVVERKLWQADSWQEIESRDVSGYWLAYVDGHEDEGVRIPFRRTRGRFNLARLENYRDFNYYLRSALLEESEAVVRFDLYVGLGGDETRVANDEKVVRKKPREIRELEVGSFVEQAAVEVLRRLTSFFGPTRTYVYLDSWQFIESERRYVIEMEITWGGTFLRQRWYRIGGLLEVKEDGSGAVFRKTKSNERGADRWEGRIDGDQLRLDDMHPRSPDESTDSSSEAG